MCSRRALALLTLAVATTACKGGKPSPQESPRPGRVILISVDTLRADRLNAYGYKARRVSPAMDRLAQEGILFEDHVSAAPWTTPSHMSLFTGLSPTAHGITRPFKVMLQELLEDQGFERLSGERPTLAEVLSKAGLRTAAFTGGVTLDGRMGFDRGFEKYHTFMGKLNERRVSRLLTWIRRNRDAPFFVFWHTFEVHAPYLHGDFLGDVLPPAEARSLHDALGSIAGRRSDAIELRPAKDLMHERRVYTRDVTSALYDGGILSMDRWLTRLFDELKALRLYDETLIVLTSDHGEQLGEKAGAAGNGSRDGDFYGIHGNTLYDELLRVPLIIKLPGVQHSGKRVSSISRTIDIMPTMLDVLGLPTPPQLQGESLRPSWERPGRKTGEAISESLSTRNEGKSVREGPYKYIVSMTTAEVNAHGRATIPARPSLVELYDLATDPGEKTNLIKKPGMAKVVTRLDALLRRRVAERVGRSSSVPIDPEALEQLRALGYVN